MQGSSPNSVTLFSPATNRPRHASQANHQREAFRHPSSEFQFLTDKTACCVILAKHVPRPTLPRDEESFPAGRSAARLWEVLQSRESSGNLDSDDSEGPVWSISEHHPATNMQFVDVNSGSMIRSANVCFRYPVIKAHLPVSRIMPLYPGSVIGNGSPGGAISLTIEAMYQRPSSLTRPKRSMAI